MGHSREEKARSRERIVEVAATRIRESGTVGPGVAEIMKAAGLTHGGFYKHFGSRDELVAEAVQAALESANPVAAGWVDGADDPLAAFVDRYLAPEHRDQPGAGCGVAGLAGDVSRGGPALQEPYRAQVERYLTQLEAILGGSDESSRREALVALSALVGALTVARAVGPGPLSDELLEAAGTAVKERSLSA